jgi:hypothetical protein
MQEAIVSTIDEEFEELQKGRGPDKQKRKKRGLREWSTIEKKHRRNDKIALENRNLSREGERVGRELAATEGKKYWRDE